jgi:hypothetical protein
VPGRPIQLTKPKILGFYLVYLVIVASFSLAAAELLARLASVEPWVVHDIEIEVTPGGRFYTPNPTLEYSHLPGVFLVTLPTGYTFHVTHLPNTLRITHPMAPYTNAPPQARNLGLGLLVHVRLVPQ